MAIQSSRIVATALNRADVPINNARIIKAEPGFPDAIRDPSVAGGYRWETTYPVYKGQLIFRHQTGDTIGQLYVAVPDALNNLSWKKVSIASSNVNSSTGSAYDPLASFYSGLAN